MLTRRKRVGNFINAAMAMPGTLAVLLAVVLAVAVMGLSGCALRSNTAKGGGAQGDGARVRIVTSFYPVYLTVINMTKDVPGVEVVNMTQPQTGCLHDYQLKPQDVEMLDRADLFVINGAGMETFMAKLLAQRGDLKVLDASAGVSLLYGGDGAANAHYWLDLDGVLRQAQNVSNELKKIDAAHAAQYAENYVEFSHRLEALAGTMRTDLESLKGKEIVTFHEAFPYFAKMFGLKIAAVIERDPGVAPTPSELEKIIATVKELGVKALFAEPQYAPKAAEVIAQETGARVYSLDPIVTGVANLDAMDDYFRKMEQNFKTLKLALGVQ